jgi:hypothetical protein
MDTVSICIIYLDGSVTPLADSAIQSVHLGPTLLARSAPVSPGTGRQRSFCNAPGLPNRKNDLDECTLWLAH